MNVDERNTVQMDSATLQETSQKTSIKTLNQLKGSRVAIESFLDRYVQSQSTRIEALAGIEWLDRIVGEASLGNFDKQAVDRWMERYHDLAQSATLSTTDRKRISSLLLELQRYSINANDNTPETDTVDLTPAPDGKTSDAPSEQIGARELRRRFEEWKQRSGSVSVSPPTADTATDRKSISPLRNSVKTDRKTDKQNTTPIAGSPRKVVLRRKSEKSDINLFERFTEQVWSELDLLYREFENDEHALIKLDQLLKYAEAKTDPMYLHLAGSLIYFLKIEGFRMAPYAERLRKIEKRFTASEAR